MILKKNYNYVDCSIRKHSGDLYSRAGKLVYVVSDLNTVNPKAPVIFSAPLNNLFRYYRCQIHSQKEVSAVSHSTLQSSSTGSGTVESGQSASTPHSPSFLVTVPIEVIPTPRRYHPHPISSYLVPFGNLSHRSSALFF